MSFNSIVIQPKKSTIWLGINAVVFLLAACAVLSLNTYFLIKLGLLALLCALIILTRQKEAVQLYYQSGRWFQRTDAGQQEELILSDGGYCSRLLIILHFKTPAQKTKRVVIFKDAISSDLFRRLFVVAQEAQA